MGFQNAANRRQNRGDIFALDPGAAARIKHGLQLFHHERHIAPAPEHGGNHPRQRHRPCKMLHVFRIDEHFKRAPVTIHHHIIHREINRMLAIGPFQLIGLPF